MAASNYSFARILPFPGERRSSIVANWPVQAERRLKFRYPTDLSVRFRYYSAGTRVSGAGLAVNISSGGLLVASQHQVAQGALVEMSIEWPCLLHGRIPLQLFAVGHVLRRGPSHFAATFDRHEFRTMKISSPQLHEEAPLLEDGLPSLTQPTPNP
jgi:hypothetical protein